MVNLTAFENAGALCYRNCSSSDCVEGIRRVSNLFNKVNIGGHFGKTKCNYFSTYSIEFSYFFFGFIICLIQRYHVLVLFFPT